MTENREALPRLWTRDELVIVVMALEEFRNESGPGQRDLAERVNAVLRQGGLRDDRFELRLVEDGA